MSEPLTTSTITQEQLSTIEQQITSNSKLVVQGSQHALANPLYAINWFDTRAAWLYHLYNYLAAGRLNKIGGRVFFKGKVENTIAGDESLARDYLLIIHYPSAKHFLDLNADTRFKIFSVLRLMAVTNFAFVFHQAIDDPDWSRPKSHVSDKSKAYALLHFGGDESAEDVVSTIREIGRDFGSLVSFAGRQAATLAVQSGNDAQQELPIVTRNLLIIEASDHGQITAMFDSRAFGHLTTQLPSFYLASVKRLL